MSFFLDHPVHYLSQYKNCLKKYFCRMGPNFDFKVRVGNHRLSNPDENEKEIKVSKIIIHEDFDTTYQSTENDICLLILSGKADISSPTVGIIELPEKNKEYRY